MSNTKGEGDGLLEEIANVNPDEWKNIPIPLVDGMNSVIKEIRKIVYHLKRDAQKMDMMDRREKDHHFSLTKEVTNTIDNMRKENQANFERVNLRFEEMRLGNERMLKENSATMTRNMDKKVGDDL